MSEQWKLGWLESYNGYTGEPERFIYSPDRATTVCVQGQDCDEHARRIQDLLNAAEGIPTDTLEAGVVVVPVEEARLAADAVAVYLSMGFQVTQAEIERMKRFLARLQNVETPSETRITATIDVQTYRGYRDRRVIEVEPGIGWADRLGLEVQRVAQEMEEFHLNGSSKKNGGADHD